MTNDSKEVEHVALALLEQFGDFAAPIARELATGSTARFGAVPG
jgi:hypothetical protein